MIRNLIYDVGLHRGEDTAYYLARGFTVVAIEADPDLVEYCESRFEKEIKSRRLVIVQGAIVEDDRMQSVGFYRNNKVSVWGTVLKNWADRNSSFGAESSLIEVPVVNIKSLLLKYGCPYYMKIDIEGMDLACLIKLLDSDCRPKYISLEADKVDFKKLQEEFRTFARLGYGSFYIQQQADIRKHRVPSGSREGDYVDYSFEDGSSGPFGSDLIGPWLTTEEALLRYKKIFREYRFFGDNSILLKFPLVCSVISKCMGRPLPGWHDTHARLD